jgi:hypothetical protein
MTGLSGAIAGQKVRPVTTGGQFSRGTEMRVFRMLAICGLLAGLTAGAQASDKLSASELQGLFPGKFQAVVSGMVTVNLTARSDGSLVGRMSKQTDQGRWFVRNGKLCIVLDKWMNGKPKCAAVTAEEGWFKAADVRFRRI